MPPRCRGRSGRFLLSPFPSLLCAFASQRESFHRGERVFPAEAQGTQRERWWRSGSSDMQRIGRESCSHNETSHINRIDQFRKPNAKKILCVTGKKPVHLVASECDTQIHIMSSSGGSCRRVQVGEDFPKQAKFVTTARHATAVLEKLNPRSGGGSVQWMTKHPGISQRLVKLKEDLIGEKPFVGFLQHALDECSGGPMLHSILVRSINQDVGIQAIHRRGRAPASMCRQMPIHPLHERSEISRVNPEASGSAGADARQPDEPPR